jgi:uncharacterized protein YutE (UPF0331/DUF86 family)
MDRDLVLAKLDALNRCIARIESKKPIDRAAFEKDFDRQDVIVLNLERAVQSCVDVAAHVVSEANRQPPGSMANIFGVLESLNVLDSILAGKMRNAVGFRNIAVHEYQEINLDILFSIVTRNLVDFRAFASAILKYMEAQ